MLDPGILAEYKAIRVMKNTSIFCHAPFTSMNFEQNGNVTVCCYNRIYALGLTSHILTAVRSAHVRLEYYNSMVCVYFHVARLDAAGELSVGGIADEVLTYLSDRQGAEGEIGPVLETAMAALTMMYFDAWDTPALERAIVRLADDPMHPNGWQPIAYANSPARAFSDGCAGLTGVFYAEALHRWVTRNESAGGSGDH